MTEPTRPSVRLGSPEELAIALPMLLGYHPTESLVISALHRPGFAVGLTLRFDLAGFDSAAAGAEEIAERLHLAGADAAFLAVYTEARSCGGRLPHADLVEALMEDVSIPIREAVLVRRGRWWSYLCSEMGCCPKAGRKIKGQTAALSRLQAALVLSGSAVLTDREALVDAVSVDPAIDVAAQRRRVMKASRAVAVATRRVRRLELADLVQRLAVRLEDPRATVEQDEAARFAALLDDVMARDDLLLQAVPPKRRDEVLRVLRSVVRQVPSPYDAPIATTLAWFAYAAGDGTLANVALSRAFATDPDYSLALLIETSLDRQLPPSALVDVMRGAARDIEARDAAG